MMGDREKCIQAQMDEYLSKPLQQNQLIQTILKCATLGGPLLEKNRERELALHSETKAASMDDDGSILRPSLEVRAFSSREPLTNTAQESPSLVSADETDPFGRSRHDLADMRSMSG